MPADMKKKNSVGKRVKNSCDYLREFLSELRN